MGMFIHGREGLQEYVTIGCLKYMKAIYTSEIRVYGKTSLILAKELCGAEDS
jgi:hypothetical protein